MNLLKANHKQVNYRIVDGVVSLGYQCFQSYLFSDAKFGGPRPLSCGAPAGPRGYVSSGFDISGKNSRS